MSIDHHTTQPSVAINTYGGTGPLRVTLQIPNTKPFRGDFINFPIRDLPALIADLQAALAVREAYPDAITITPQQAADAAHAARVRAGFNTQTPEN